MIKYIEMEHKQMNDLLLRQREKEKWEQRSSPKTRVLTKYILWAELRISLIFLYMHRYKDIKINWCNWIEYMNIYIYILAEKNKDVTEPRWESK